MVKSGEASLGLDDRARPGHLIPSPITARSFVDADTLGVSDEEEPRGHVLGSWAEEVIDEDEPDDEEEDDDEYALWDGCGQHALRRVDAITSRAIDQLDESFSTEVIENGVDSPSQPADRRRKVARGRRCLMGTGAAPNPNKGPQIAQILKTAPELPAQVWEYASEKDFGRVPHFLRQLRTELDAEQDYIDLLREPRPRAEPKTVVRLLTQSEKDDLVSALRQKFQFATASYLAAKPGSRSKKEIRG